MNYYIPRIARLEELLCPQLAASQGYPATNCLVSLDGTENVVRLAALRPRTVDQLLPLRWLDSRTNHLLPGIGW